MDIAKYMTKQAIVSKQVLHFSIWAYYIIQDNIGKSLVGDKSGQWRYRIGDYRAICEIQDDKIIVLVLEVGHRREVYE